MICAKLDYELTDRQSMMLTFISDYINKNKYPPIQKEIIEYFREYLKMHPMTRSICHDELVALKQFGRIDYIKGQPRTITLLRPAPIEYNSSVSETINPNSPFNRIACHICGHLINKNFLICPNCDTVAKIYGGDYGIFAK